MRALSDGTIVRSGRVAGARTIPQTPNHHAVYVDHPAGSRIFLYWLTSMVFAALLCHYMAVYGFSILIGPPDVEADAYTIRRMLYLAGPWIIGLTGMLGTLVYNRRHARRRNYGCRALFASWGRTLLWLAIGLGLCWLLLLILSIFTTLVRWILGIIIAIIVLWLLSR